MEKLFSGYVYAGNTCKRLYEFLSQKFENAQQVVFLCLGTDRIMEDCLAPLVAERMRDLNVSSFIYGGARSPITAKNAEFAFNFIKAMHPRALVCLVDSLATYDSANLGNIYVTKQYIGAVNRLNLTPDLCIYGTTAIISKRTKLLGYARLKNVLAISKCISTACAAALDKTKATKFNLQQVC